MKTYRVVVTRDQGWWTIQVPAAGAMSAATRLADVVQVAKGMTAAVLGTTPGRISVEVEVRANPSGSPDLGLDEEHTASARFDVVVDARPVEDDVPPEDFAQLLDEIIAVLDARGLRFELSAHFTRRRAVFHVHPGETTPVPAELGRLVRGALHAAGATQSGMDHPFPHWSANVTVIDVGADSHAGADVPQAPPAK